MLNHFIQRVCYVQVELFVAQNGLEFGLGEFQQNDCCSRRERFQVLVENLVLFSLFFELFERLRSDFSHLVRKLKHILSRVYYIGKTDTFSDLFFSLENLSNTSRASESLLQVLKTERYQ